MAPEAQESDLPDELGDDSFAQDQLAALDGDLMRGMPSDARYESGVPDGQRAGTLDFIQMTGLTRRAPLPPREERAAHQDTDEGPLSFYEAGVSDVDESMRGGQVETGLPDASLDADLVPDRAAEPLDRGESPSVRAFRDIIAELEAGGSSGETEASVPVQEYDVPGEGDGTLEDDFQAIADDLSAENIAEPAAEAPTPVPPAGLPADIAEPAETEPVALASSPPEPAAEPDTPEPAPQDDEDDFDALVASLEATGSTSPPAEESPEIAEDWDALLDSVSQEEQPEGGEAEPDPRRNSAPLEEAGQLMSSLGAAPATTPPSPAPPAVTEPAGVPAETYDYSAAPTRRRSRRHSRVARRGWRLVKLTFLLALVAVAGGALWYYALAPWIEQPEDLEAHANRLLSEHRYVAASDAFLRLSSGSGSNSADAQFEAAQVLTLGVEGLPIDEVTARFQRAKDLFTAFIAENPQHPKSARALCIVGRLEYELGNYDSAISILRDQIQPEDDPAAALAMLRYLARSYVQTNAFEEAETAYLQAATLPGNYNAETDYQELGDLFRMRASYSGVAVPDAESFKTTAASYWNKALQVPGIDPGTAKELQERLEWLEFTEKTGVEPGTAVQPAVDAPMAVPVEPAPSTSEQPALSPIPAQDGPGDRVEDPGAALETSVQTAGPAENAAMREEATP